MVNDDVKDKIDPDQFGYLKGTSTTYCLLDVNKHPDHGMVLLGDFNDFDCSNLVSHHSLKQVVQQPTRNSAILDLILTNMPK